LSHINADYVGREEAMPQKTYWSRISLSGMGRSQIVTVTAEDYHSAKRLIEALYPGCSFVITPSTFKLE